MPFSVHVIFQPKVDENYIVLFLADVLLQNWVKWFCDTCGTIFFQSKNGRQGFWTTSGTIDFVNALVWVSLITEMEYGMEWWNGKWNGMVNVHSYSLLM